MSIDKSMLDSYIENEPYESDDVYPSIALQDTQYEVGEWANHNFPNHHAYQALLGMMEELGELTHAHLKAEQNIRGSARKHKEAAKDAIGDLIIYLLHYCTKMDYDLATIIADTWNEVRKRDWIQYPKDGINE